MVKRVGMNGVSDPIRLTALQRQRRVTASHPPLGRGRMIRRLALLGLLLLLAGFASAEASHISAGCLPTPLPAVPVPPS